MPARGARTTGPGHPRHRSCPTRCSAQAPGRCRTSSRSGRCQSRRTSQGRCRRWSGSLQACRCLVHWLLKVAAGQTVQRTHTSFQGLQQHLHKGVHVMRTSEWIAAAGAKAGGQAPLGPEAQQAARILQGSSMPLQRASALACMARSDTPPPPPPFSTRTSSGSHA